MTSIGVQIRSGRKKQLLQHFETIKQESKYLFPGTIARYIVGSDTQPDEIEIVLVWRKTVMPNETVREQELEALRQELAEMLNWQTARYSHGSLIHAFDHRSSLFCQQVRAR